MSELTLVRSSDYAQLSRFHAAFPGEVRTPAFWEQRFRYWWDDNPAFDEDVPRGWMLRDGTGAIGGFLGNVPSFFRMQGREQRVFGATSWRVLQEHRSSSIPLYLAHMEAGASSLLFNTTPSESAVRVLEYLKYRSVPSSSSGRAFHVAVRAGAAMGAYLRDRQVPEFVKWVAGAPLRLAQIPLETVLRCTSRAGVRVLSHADSAFDDLWHRTCNRHTNTSVRSAAQVNWLCFSNPDFRKTLIGCYEHGKLRGFAIFADARPRGVKALELCDLWTEAPDDGVTRAILAGTWDHAKRNDYAVIVLHDYSAALTRLFRRLGLFFTTGDTTRIFYRSPDSANIDLALGDSYLTGLEGDRAL